MLNDVNMLHHFDKYLFNGCHALTTFFMQDFCIFFQINPSLPLFTLPSMEYSRFMWNINFTFINSLLCHGQLQASHPRPHSLGLAFEDLKDSVKAIAS